MVLRQTDDIRFFLVGTTTPICIPRLLGSKTFSVLANLIIDWAHKTTLSTADFNSLLHYSASVDSRVTRRLTDCTSLMFPTVLSTYVAKASLLESRLRQSRGLTFLYVCHLQFQSG